MSRSPRLACALLLALAGLLCLTAAAVAADKDWPRPRGAVADYARLIPPGEEAKLEILCRRLLKSTGAAVVIVTLPSLGTRTVEEEAVHLYETWGIGKKGESRGVLMLLAKKERRFRIEVGLGLEGILPDARVGQIGLRYIIPHFKKGRFAQGFMQGLAAVAQVIAKEKGLTLQQALGVKEARPAKRRRSGRAWPFILLALTVFIIFGIFRRRLRLAGRRRTTGNELLLGGLLGLGLGRMGSGGGLGGGGFGSFGGGFGGFGGGISGGGGGSFSF